MICHNTLNCFLILNIVSSFCTQFWKVLQNISWCIWLFSSLRLFLKVNSQREEYWVKLYKHFPNYIPKDLQLIFFFKIHWLVSTHYSVFHPRGGQSVFQTFHLHSILKYTVSLLNNFSPVNAIGINPQVTKAQGSCTQPTGCPFEGDLVKK